MSAARSPRPTELSIAVPDPADEAAPAIAEVDALLLRPRGAKWLYLMAHGAGADMHHEFMVAMAEALHDRGVATLRYQFPYTQAGRKRPDHQKKLVATVRAAIATARRKVRLPLVAGGKSMGGRMTSLALAERPDSAVSGLLFLGFPLHPAGKPGIERAAHLSAMGAPMLFIQGTRDALANLQLMTEVENSLQARGADVNTHVVADGDHSFKVLKRTAKTRAQVLDDIAEAILQWGARWQL